MRQKTHGLKDIEMFMLSVNSLHINQNSFKNYLLKLDSLYTGTYGTPKEFKNKRIFIEYFQVITIYKIKYSFASFIYMKLRHEMKMILIIGLSCLDITKLKKIYIRLYIEVTMKQYCQSNLFSQLLFFNQLIKDDF